MKLMKTAEEMMRFCVDNKTGYYSIRYLRHFKVIEDCLQEDEYVLCCFAGGQMVDQAFHSIKDRRYSLAMTNRRLVMGQRSGMGDDLQFIWYKELNGIELTKDSITVDAEKNWPCIQVTEEGVPYLRERLSDIMAEIKRKKTASKVGAEGSPADEIRKFKGLFDDGIITEEEFLRKKEQLLDEGAPSQLQGDDVVLTVNPADYRPNVNTEEYQTRKKETSIEVRDGIAGKDSVDTRKQRPWVLTGVLLTATLAVVSFGIYMIFFVEV